MSMLTLITLGIAGGLLSLFLLWLVTEAAVWVIRRFGG